MTASRARSSDIGNERENSRIGGRWDAGPADELESSGDFFRAMRVKFAPQQAATGFAPKHLTC